MAAENGLFDVSTELAALKYEMKNQNMKCLPPGMTIKRNAIHHQPVASPYAGVDVQKVVYVSCSTPIMSAVKRVKKLLSLVEKRAMQPTNKAGHRLKPSFGELADASAHLAKANEEILVKASGRATSQALRVGKWFQIKEKEMMCNVEIRENSIQVIDDIVNIDEVEEIGDVFGEEKGKNGDSAMKEETTLEGGDTTMELLGGTNEPAEPVVQPDVAEAQEQATEAPKESDVTEVTKGKKKRRCRRKRAAYDPAKIPEARIRWIKTVEIAISLKA